MEFSLLGAALVAALAAYGILRFEAGRTNAADCTRQLWDGLVTALVVGLVVGRITAMIAAGTNPITNPADLLIVRGGVDTIAAGLAGIGAYAFVMRSDLWRLAGAIAPRRQPPSPDGTPVAPCETHVLEPPPTSRGPCPGPGASVAIPWRSTPR